MRSGGRSSSIGCCWGCCLSELGRLTAVPPRETVMGNCAWPAPAQPARSCWPATLARAGAHLPAARLKDLVAIEGVRDNQLIGYGLVVGLAGTGDRQQTMFSAQSLTNMLERMGVSVSTLPPFA